MTGDSHIHAKHLMTALQIYGDKTRIDMLDSLACYLHNEGHGLRGNTEAKDSLWLAKSMFIYDLGQAWPDWDRLSPKAQDEYIKFASFALRALPGLCERIASRYVHAAVAVRTAWDMEKGKNPREPRKAE